MFAKSAKLAVILGAAALALTACTPPMPPEVKAALLEQTYTCFSGNVNVASGEALSDAIPTIQGSMQTACPNMSITAAAKTATAADTGISISASPVNAAKCVAVTTVPYALDAAVIAASLANAAGLQLSPTTVAGIFDGSIKTWNDPKITADNSGSEIATGAISVIPTTDKLALNAFGAWYQSLTGKTFKARFLTQAKNGESLADLGDMAEGSIALMPYSTFTAYSVNAMTIPLAANILLDAKTQESATPDVTGVVSAGTQLVTKKSASGLTVKMDFAAKPTPPQGSDVAPTPYGAIYPVNLSLCASNGTAKTANKVTHAVARYLLRQDSQGALTALAGLPDLVRATALDSVSAGLPDPKIPASTN